ncbi:MAG TPA: hypothetical protein D7I09_02445 [Candidatus Poseidoniales archaeon]|nr:MAG TPA: hypothetical protein D7I09_02445 [Candidatus Poseidoniales archaeon]HII18197.1 hypothetical protein [Candidatus Poseidoniaceae archaeon]
MKRLAVLLIVSALLMAPSFGAANPNGVGEGTFDAQCGGACHGDADMNRSSASTVSISVEHAVYEGLLTSVSVTVTNVQTTDTGLLGFFLLSDVSGAEDTPEDDGWTVVSNSEGGSQNYVEVVVPDGTAQHTVEWTLRAPSAGAYDLHASVHHGARDGSGAPFFGVTTAPVSVQVDAVPDDLPRLSEGFQPPVMRTVGESTVIRLTTEAVHDLDVEWRVDGGAVRTAAATSQDNGVWTFEIPASLAPVLVEWRVHLEGEGPTQTTPWVALQSQEPTFESDDMTVYAQAFAMLVAFLVAFIALPRKTLPHNEQPKLLPFADEVMP